MARVDEDESDTKRLRSHEAGALRVLKAAGSPDLLIFYERRFADVSRPAPTYVRMELIAEAERDAEIVASPAENGDARILRWEGKKAKWIAVIEGCSVSHVYKVRKRHRAHPQSPFPGRAVLLAALNTGAAGRARRRKRS